MEHNEKEQPESIPESFTTKEERALIRRYDWFLLPSLAFMYLCNALDKGGSSKSQDEALPWPGDRCDRHIRESRALPINLFRVLLLLNQLGFTPCRDTAGILVHQMHACGLRVHYLRRCWSNYVTPFLFSWRPVLSPPPATLPDCILALSADEFVIR
jgi:hypothetical protein